MKIDIDQNLVQKAIFDNISQQQRDALVTMAIQNLFKEGTNSAYGRNRSELEVIFEHSAKDVAREVLHEEFKREDIKEKFRVVIHDVLFKALEKDDGYDGLVEQLAKNFVEAMKGKERY